MYGSRAGIASYIYIQIYLMGSDVFLQVSIELILKKSSNFLKLFENADPFRNPG